MTSYPSLFYSNNDGGGIVEWLDLSVRCSPSKKKQTNKKGQSILQILVEVRFGSPVYQVLSLVQSRGAVHGNIFFFFCILLSLTKRRWRLSITPTGTTGLITARR